MAETEIAAVGVVNGGPALGGFSKEKLLDLLKHMLLYRRFEEKAEEAYTIGKIGGFCHLHIGQEAAAAGCILPLRQDDGSWPEGPRRRGYNRTSIPGHVLDIQPGNARHPRVHGCDQPARGRDSGCRRREEVPVAEAGQVVIRNRMKMTMSCDHRVIDGALGATFLATLKGMLEEPTAILL